MNNKPRFIKKRLSQIIAAGLLTSMGISAQAGDFSLTNNQITAGAVIDVDAAGVASAATIAAGGPGGLPNVSFGLNNLSNSTGSFYVRLLMKVESQTKEHEVSLRIGVIKVDVTAGAVNNVAVVTQAQHNYEPVVVNAVRQTNSGTTALDSTFRANANMVSFAGGNVTVQVDNVLTSLLGNNPLFDDIINGFLQNDHYDYTIAVQPVEGPTALTVGYNSGTYTPFPRLLGGCTAFTVLGTLTVGTPAAALIPAVAQADNCGGGGSEPVPPGVVDALDQNNQVLANLVAEELASGSVSESTIALAVNNLENAATITQTFAQAAQAGETLNASSVLTAVQVTSNTASITSQVAAAAPTSSQNPLIDNNLQLISSAAVVLSALAEQGVTLSGTETNQLNQIVTNVLSTLDNLADTAASSPEQLIALAQQANSIIQAKADLGIAATAAQSELVEEISQKLGLAVITKVLTDAGQPAPSEEDIQQALLNDPELLDAVIAASLALPPTQTETPAATRDRILDAFASLYPGVPVPTGMIAPGNVGRFTFNGAVFTPNEVVSILLTGESANGASLAFSNGRQVQALTAADVSITADPVTGVLSIVLPGESYSGVVTAIKSVPTSVATGISFLQDGTALVVRSGYAVELAPVSVDQLAFAAATLRAGYQPTLRSNGSFSLNLGGTQRFSGAFGYDNLTGKNLANCGTITFAEPTGPVNSASYAFVANCSTGGISQRILPFVDNANFFTSVAGHGSYARADRSTGIITITGLGKFKPSFFVDAATSADLSYHAANKDVYGIAYQGGDFNGDGKLDYKVISATGVQVLYGTN